MGTWKNRRVKAAQILVIAASAGILAAAPLTWEIEVVDHTGPGKYSSLKFDTKGNAHLAFIVEDSHHTLKYAFWDHALKKWFVMTVATEASFCSLAVDSKQHPHISWADFGTGSGTKLRYAHFDGTQWEQEPIRLHSDVVAYYTSVAVDPNDMPAISYYEYRGAKGSDEVDRLRVVTRRANTWEVRTVDPEPQSGKFNAIAIDPGGGIHVAYANVSGMFAGMRYAFGSDKHWRVEILEGLRENKGGYVGFSANIALDKESNPHVTYMNQSNGTVKYAVRRNGVWRIQAVGRVSKVGYPDRNSIALDDDGRPYITYYDAGAGALMISYPDGKKWIAEVIDGDSAGFTSSVQIDNGKIWVSYADEGVGGIKVAHADLPGGLSPMDSAPALKVPLPPKVPFPPKK